MRGIREQAAKCAAATRTFAAIEPLVVGAPERHGSTFPVVLWWSGVAAPFLRETYRDPAVRPFRYVMQARAVSVAHARGIRTGGRETSARGLRRVQRAIRIGENRAEGERARG